MKILFVSGNLIGGGAEKVLTQLANSFSGKGHQVSIVQFVGSDHYPLEDGIEVLSFQNRTALKKNGTLSKIRYLRTVIKLQKPDIVISFMTGANIVTLLASIGLRAKVIVSERNDPNRVPKEKSQRILRKLLYPISAGFVFQTNDARDFFSKKIAKRSMVIKNPLSRNLPERFAGEREKTIVMAGRLENAKNYPLAILAFSIVHETFPDYTLKIFGEGSKKEGLEQLVKDKELTNCVCFEGFSVNWQERAKRASVFVLSSDFEGMSNSLMEAMAMGIPCISTDHPIGGARDLIQSGENGILVPVGDVNAMATAILAVLNDEALSKKLSDSCIKIRDELNTEKISDQWLEYCRKIIGGQL